MKIRDYFPQLKLSRRMNTRRNRFKAVRNAFNIEYQAVEFGTSQMRRDPSDSINLQILEMIFLAERLFPATPRRPRLKRVSALTGVTLRDLSRLVLRHSRSAR